MQRCLWRLVLLLSLSVLSVIIQLGNCEFVYHDAILSNVKPVELPNEQLSLVEIEKDYWVVPEESKHTRVLDSNETLAFVTPWNRSGYKIAELISERID